MIDTLRQLDTNEGLPEQCGLITSKGQLLFCTNIHENPLGGYRMDPEQALAALQGHEIFATFHTHPGADCNLSQEDYAGFTLWPDLIHFIVGTDGVKRYWFDDGILMQEVCK